jgi:hypothetical protein
MTPKFLAKRTMTMTGHHRQCVGIETEDGVKFTWQFLQSGQQDIKVGDKAWVAKRLNVSKEGLCYEVYEVTIEEDAYMVKNGHKHYPKTWFGKGRQIVVKVN